ncbi:MAG: hypothetical protein AAFN93_14990 [Bacteroidota bacterium]
MKKIIYTLLALCFLMSCDDDFDIADQGFDLEPLPESVSFDGGGDGIDADDDGDEGDDITITVEAPNGSEADIVVTYTLSGTATFGTDYTIAGATASGGSVTIIDDRSDVVNFDNGIISPKSSSTTQCISHYDISFRTVRGFHCYGNIITFISIIICINTISTAVKRHRFW